MSLTILIIAITVLISVKAFSDNGLLDKFILWPRRMQSNPQEYYRLVSYGCIHADWNHLLFNMVSLYFIGKNVEEILGFGYLILYYTALIVSALPSFLKNRNNSFYRSLGASGAVSAVLFFFIYYEPWSTLRIMFIPVDIYCAVYGVVYLAIEIYMSKRGSGNVNHDAHIWGAVYGLFYAFLVDPSHGTNFLYTITHLYR